MRRSAPLGDAADRNSDALRLGHGRRYRGALRHRIDAGVCEWRFKFVEIKGAGHFVVDQMPDRVSALLILDVQSIDSGA